MKLYRRLISKLSFSLVGVMLTACGGGGSGSLIDNSSDEPVARWQQGVFPRSESLEARCALPRSGTDANGNSFPDRPGTELDEKMWLRSWSDEFYLWYDEIPDRNPGPFSVSDYFDVLKTPELTPSLRPKDNFHFAVSTDEWLQLSQSGVRSGYGVRFSITGNNPRTVRVLYVEPNSPAAAPGVALLRGTHILQVDGVSVESTSSAEVSVINAGLSPAENGESHEFLVRDVGATMPRIITMQSADVVSTPVQFVQTFESANGQVGYMLFNDHIATAESGLVNAINVMSQASVSELILDMRYNGGGFLAIASQLAYMIAGRVPTDGRTFESLQFNDKNPNTNPFTGNALTPTPFYDETLGFSLSSGQNLPTLNLDRVFVLTGPNTCSASEAIINGLRGVGVEVIQIGKTTCGKPYGFFPTDNCGMTWFSIHFQGVNDAGFGEYPDGFSPVNSNDAFGVSLPGCDVGDDLEHQFSDVDEARIAAALHYIENGTCPASSSKPGLNKLTESVQEPALINVSPAQQNRIMGLPK